MHMLPRTLWHSLVVAKTKPAVNLSAVTRTTFRVWPTDVDILLHMNNGKYLSVLDVARLEYTMRSGLWQKFKQHGIYTVVGAQTISYRKSLNPWRKFTVETRLIGMDQRAAYIEQRFVRRGEIYARAFIQGRFVKRSGGTATMAELCEILGVDQAAFPLPAELAAWAQAVKLPATRQAAPSIWE